MPSQSIFGSGAERETFLAIRRKWQGEVDVFPQVPVKTVVGFERVQTIPNESERKYLLQTEFDCVVCKKNSGIPILVIEFDGMCRGFSRVLAYETRGPARGQNRRKKLEAKLRICADAEIAAIVVSTPEQEQIDEASYLTILDGIVGEVLASTIFNAEVERRTFRSVDEVEDLEIQLSLSKNPINKEIIDVLTALHTADETAWLRSQKPLDDRKQEGMVGCHSRVKFAGKEYEASAYVREINCRGFAAYGLAERLSELGAYKKALRASGLKPSAPRHQNRW